MRDLNEIELERIALKEAAEKAVEAAKRNGAKIHPRVATIKARAALGE